VMKNISFPEDSDRKVPKDKLKLVSRSLAEHVAHSQQKCYFQFLIFKLIYINHDVRKLVRKMMPPDKDQIKFRTLMYLLGNLFQNSKSIGIDNQIHDENKFNKIHSFVMTMSWAYPMNFGLLIEEGKPQIRLKNIET